MKDIWGSLDRRRFLGLGTVAAAGGLLSDANRPTSAASGPDGKLCFARDIPVCGEYDVVVCGGGPSGITAALAARRAGLRVLLVEGQGQLGGTGISSLVSHWLGGRSSDCRSWVVGGIFRSLVQEAADKDIALIPVFGVAKPKTESRKRKPGRGDAAKGRRGDFGRYPPVSASPPLRVVIPPQSTIRNPKSEIRYQPHGWYMGQLAAGIPFDPFRMAHLLDGRMARAKVETLLLTQVVDAVVEDDRITHIVLFNKSGLSAVATRAVVDATGDADVAARTGCECVLGREEDGLMTPTTLMFHVDHVDQQSLSDYIHEHDSPRFRRKIAELRKSGEWKFPYEIFISVQLDEPGTMMINTIRLVGIDGTDGPSKTEGMIRGREEVEELFSLMKKHFPGFGKSRLKAVAPLLGVRETRRIRGPYVLTVADLNAGRDFEDTIGFSAYGWDLPDPKRPSHNPAHGKKSQRTPIPYRIMVPRPIRNLICPGRAMSVERPVLGPLRVMAPCMAMGEAAGEATALALTNNVPFTAVDVATLRQRLRKHGAIID